MAKGPGGRVKSATLEIAYLVFTYIIKTFITIGGFKGWVIKFVLTEMYDEIGEPIIKRSINEMGYQIDCANGKVLIERIDKAKEEKSYAEYRKSVDNLFNTH